MQTLKHIHVLRTEESTDPTTELPCFLSLASSLLMPGAGLSSSTDFLSVVVRASRHHFTFTFSCGIFL